MEGLHYILDKGIQDAYNTCMPGSEFSIHASHEFITCSILVK